MVRLFCCVFFAALSWCAPLYCQTASSTPTPNPNQDLQNHKDRLSPQQDIENPHSGTDQIIFSNGDRLTGVVRQMKSDAVLFVSDSVGEILVSREKIRELRHDDHLIPLDTQRTKQAENAVNLTSVTESTTTVRSATFSDLTGVSGGKKTYPCKRKALDGKGALYPSQWSFSLNGAPGESVIYGTQSQQTLGGTVIMTFCETTELDQTTVLLGGTHTRSSKIGAPSITGDISDDSLVQKHLFSKPSGAGIYGITDAYLNNSLGLVLQKSFGVGLLAPEFGNQTFSYTAMVDFRYINQRFYGLHSNSNLAGIRLNESATYQGKRIGFSQQVSVIPILNDLHALQLSAIGGPSLTLAPWVCIGLNEEEHYLGNALRGKRKNYLASTVKLTIKHASTACK